MWNKNPTEQTRKHEIKKLKIQNNYRPIDWNQIMLVLLLSTFITVSVVLIASVWFANTVAVAISDGMGTVSENLAVAIDNNPELAMLGVDDGLPDEMIYLSLAKQMSAEAEVDFYGRFTTRTEREMEKVDLTCIDEYEYKQLLKSSAYYLNSEEYVNNFVARQQYHDEGCSEYGQSGNLTYYKCPKRNCKLKEVKYEVADEFIPEKLGVYRVEVGGQK